MSRIQLIYENINLELFAIILALLVTFLSVTSNQVTVEVPVCEMKKEADPLGDLFDFTGSLIEIRLGGSPENTWQAMPVQRMLPKELLHSLNLRVANINI